MKPQTCPRTFKGRTGREPTRPRSGIHPHCVQPHLPHRGPPSLPPPPPSPGAGGGGPLLQLLGASLPAGPHCSCLPPTSTPSSGVPKPQPGTCAQMGSVRSEAGGKRKGAIAQARNRGGAAERLQGSNFHVTGPPYNSSSVGRELAVLKHLLASPQDKNRTGVCKTLQSCTSTLVFTQSSLSCDQLFFFSFA